MADFCKQCSIEHFGEDFEELKGLSTPEDTAKGLYAVGICEGCGGSRFDHEGICQGNCIEKHGPDKGEYPGPPDQPFLVIRLKDKFGRQK